MMSDLYTGLDVSPAPWRVGKDGETILDETSFRVARLPKRNDRTAANANLIIAAPKMYRALVNLALWASHNERGEMPAFLQDEVMDALNTARRVQV